MTCTARAVLPVSSAVTATSAPFAIASVPDGPLITIDSSVRRYVATKPSSLFTVIDVSETAVAVPCWVSTVW